MTVEADSAADAIAKAKRNEWENIEYDQAELVDWQVTGKPILDL